MYSRGSLLVTKLRNLRQFHSRIGITNQPFKIEFPCLLVTCPVEILKPLDVLLAVATAGGHPPFSPYLCHRSLAFVHVVVVGLLDDHLPCEDADAEELVEFGKRPERYRTR